MRSKRTRRIKPKKRFNIIQFLLHILMSVKLYHWKTNSYATHESTDKLYNELNEQIDKFIEIMLGKGVSKELINVKGLKFQSFTFEQFKKYINNCKRDLSKLSSICKEINESDTDLLNIRDEILGSLNQFSYLLGFK